MLVPSETLSGNSKYSQYLDRLEIITMARIISKILFYYNQHLLLVQNQYSLGSIITLLFIFVYQGLKNRHIHLSSIFHISLDFRSRVLDDVGGWNTVWLL